MYVTGESRLLAPSEDSVRSKGRRYEAIVRALHSGFGVLVIAFSSLLHLSHYPVRTKH